VIYRFIKFSFIFLLSFQLLADPKIGDEIEVLGKTALRYFNGKSFVKSEIIGALKVGEKRKILEIKPWKNTDGSAAYIFRVGRVINGEEVSDGEVFYRENSETLKLIGAKPGPAEVPMVQAAYVEAKKGVPLYDHLGHRSFEKPFREGEKLILVIDPVFYPQNPKAEWLSVKFPNLDENYLIHRKDFNDILISSLKGDIEKLNRDESVIAKSCQEPIEAAKPAQLKKNPIQRVAAVKLQSSQNLINIIKLTEGCFARPYICPAGYSTIGCGHRCDDNCPVIISKEEMDRLLSEDIKKFERLVQSEFPNVLFTQGQFDALVSIAFNMGNKFSPRKDRRFARLIDEYLGANKVPSEKQLLEVAGEISRYQYSNQDPLLGLQRRRTIESILFVSNTLPAGLLGVTAYPKNVDTIIRPYYDKFQSNIPKKYQVEYLGD